MRDFMLFSLERWINLFFSSQIFCKCLLADLGNDLSISFTIIIMKKKLPDPGEISCISLSIIENKPKNMHRRTISRTSDNLLEEIQLLTPTHSKAKFSELHTTRGGFGNILQKKSPKNPIKQRISEEEEHIRKIIEERKFLSPLQFLASENFASSDTSRKRDSQETEKISFNSSTTAFSINEENSIGRILFLLEANLFPHARSKKVLNFIAELLEKSPEPHFTLVLNENWAIQGVYYIELSTGCFHRILAMGEMPFIIPSRRVKVFLLFDNKRFITSTSSKFDAVIIKMSS